MRNAMCFLVLAGLAVVLLFRAEGIRADQPVALNVAAPELMGIQEWINSKPLTLKELRGQVVALHFWTFG